MFKRSVHGNPIKVYTGSAESWSMIDGTYPLQSRSNILNATEKLDSGILRTVTKNKYLLKKVRRFCHLGIRQAILHREGAMPEP